MRKHIRQFRGWTRKNKARIEKLFNCFEKFLPPKEQRTAFWVIMIMIGALGLGSILGVAYAEINELRKDQKALRIWVDDRA